MKLQKSSPKSFSLVPPTTHTGQRIVRIKGEESERRLGRERKERYGDEDGGEIHGKKRQKEE